MEPNDQLLISDYLADDLSPEERLAVEKRLQQEETFAEMFREHEAQIQILRAAVRAEAKAELREQFEAFQQQKKPIPFTRQMWTVSAIAAAVALLLLFWFRPWQGPALSAEQLAMNYLEPFPMDMDRGRVGESPVMRDSAFQLYRTTDFEGALPLLTELYEQNPADHVVTMYLAESLSMTGQYQEAAAVFATLVEDSPFPDAAQWRLALNLLLGGEEEKAKHILAKIQSSNHYKTKEATDLLEALNR